MIEFQPENIDEFGEYPEIPEGSGSAVPTEPGFYLAHWNSGEEFPVELKIADGSWSLREERPLSVYYGGTALPNPELYAPYVRLHRSTPRFEEKLSNAAEVLDNLVEYDEANLRSETVSYAKFFSEIFRNEAQELRDQARADRSKP